MQRQFTFKKPLAARILGLIAIYCTVFAVLITIQFFKRGNFSLTVGSMLIRGQYQLPSEGHLTAAAANPAQNPGIHSLTGGVRLSFGGLEFNMREERQRGLFLVDTNGLIQPVSPQQMILSDNSAFFILPGGTRLIFSPLSYSEGSELRITADFAENISSLNLPFRTRHSLFVSGNGQLGLIYEGKQYFFSSYSRIEDGRHLVLSAGNTMASFRGTIHHHQQQDDVFNPADFIISQALTLDSYNNKINRWLSESFTYWQQNVPARPTAEKVAALMSESLRQGNYRAAFALIPSAFLASPQNNHEAFLFAGGSARAYQSFNNFERDKTNLITNMINAGSFGFLNQNQTLDFLMVRGLTSFANNVLDMVRTIDVSEVSLEDSPGLFELYMDFERWHLPGTNPVQRLTNQICFLISQNIQHDRKNELVFVRNNGEIDLDFNLRLGKALANWAANTERNEWAAVGRSLVISAITQGGNSESARFYRMLGPGIYTPRAVRLMDGLFAWTVSSEISAAAQQGGNVLALNLSFPVNESHYVILRGVRPFHRIQIHNTDWRSDPRFEFFDASGWAYFPQQQTLLLKVRHRSYTEQVRIYFTPPPAPIPIQTEGAYD